MATRPAARGARPVRAPCGPPASLAAASVVSRAPQPAPGRAGARGRAAASGAAGAWAPWERAAGRPRGGRSPGVLTPPQAPHGRGVHGVTALGDPERWLPTGNEHGPRPEQQEVVVVPGREHWVPGESSQPDWGPREEL